MADEKLAILRETTFTVEEGFLYRACRTLSIWLNKLFFSSAVLLVIWVLLAYATGDEGCTASRDIDQVNGNFTDSASEQCSTFLTPTAKYLGAMTVLSFVMSLVFGGLGLLVGKRILEATPAMDEAGAPGHVRSESPENERKP